MNHQQIAAIYDSLTPEQQDMPRTEFIKRVSEAIDPGKITADAKMLAESRIRRKQIDQALRGGHA